MRLNELDEARINCDVRAMMYLVRTALSRDLGGMGSVDLYRHSYTGTKELIERYVDSAVKTIEALVEKSAVVLPEGMQQKDLLDGLLQSRQSFGRSALLLSGGATFGMMHIGVLKALFEAKLLPRIISGASAGSIVCAVLCTRTDAEIPRVLETFPYGDLAVFSEEGKDEGVLDHVKRLLTQGSWCDIGHLTRVMRLWLGDLTFQEAYNRTRRILNICVSTASIYELPRLLNYVTSPNLLIWSAVAASCSVPLVFNSTPLLVKDPITGEHRPWDPTPQRWVDGSVDNDLPMMRLAEMFNVNHFIVSQVNPHVVPFLSRDDYVPPPSVASSRSQEPPKKQASAPQTDWLYTVTTLARDEALHRMQFVAEMGIFPNAMTKLRSILSQRYSGDINILPEISVHDLPKILKNPTPEFMQRACLHGERATWPRLSRIRDRCAIELALDRAVHALRARVVFSKSQVDLRRMLAWGNGMTPEEQNNALGIVSTKRRRPVSVRPLHPSRRAVSRHRGPRRVHGGHRDEEDTMLAPPYPRHRRASGSSIQLLLTNPSRRRRTLADVPPWSAGGDISRTADDVLTDDETEEEERLELSRANSAATLVRRNTHGGINSLKTPMSTSPRLRRSARSQLHVPQLNHHGSSHNQRHLTGGATIRPPTHLNSDQLDLGPQTSSAQSSVATAVDARDKAFDFGKPLTPQPQGRNQKSEQSKDEAPAANDNGGDNDDNDGAFEGYWDDMPRHDRRSNGESVGKPGQADSRSGFHNPGPSYSLGIPASSPRLDVLSPTTDDRETSDVKDTDASDNDNDESNSHTDDESLPPPQPAAEGAGHDGSEHSGPQMAKGGQADDFERPRPALVVDSGGGGAWH